ncbi:hypothetical protein IT575_14315 [bacterium]|nr:hypothetical protein [bacterium]
MSEGGSTVSLVQARGRLIAVSILPIFLGLLVPEALERHAQTGFYTKYASSVWQDYLYVGLLLLVMAVLIWIALSDFLKARRQQSA